ncbi:hypothetical protein, partial [Mycobacterium sp.]|uniref:hypothetical protein n=1 Tax=Mycobacterium sp. TaxID=1785 RepID=UPI002B857296
RGGELVGQQLLNIDRVGIGHRVVLLRLTWRSFEGSRDDRPLPGYDTPPAPYTTRLDATVIQRHPHKPVARSDHPDGNDVIGPVDKLLGGTPDLV